MPDVSTVVNRALGHFTMEDLISAVIMLAVCLLAVKLLLKILDRLLGRTKLEDRVRRYVLLGLKAVLYTLTVVFTAGAMGIDMSSLVALLSVCSLGVTLAAEDVLGNMAGGLVIFSSHPFALGDFIEADGAMGTVELITLNHTRILTPDGYTALLPNKELASAKVINYTTLGRRRITWKMSASYDAPTQSVKDACWEALRETPNILEDPEPTVFLTKLADSGIEYTIYIWTKTDDWWATQFILSENLRKSFDRHNVQIPYNKLDVQIIDHP